VRLQPPPVREVAFGTVDHPPLLHHVGESVGEPGGGRLPVAAGPAGLLVVALDGPRHVQMRHETDVRLVDAHAERDRGDDHEPVLAQEPGLVRGTSGRVQARVIGQRGDAVVGQERGGLLGRVPGQAVDDPGVARVFGAQEGEQLALGVVLGNDAVLDVRPVERGDEHPGVRQLEPDRDLLAGGLRGGGGQRDPRHVRPAFVQHLKFQVVGAEIVAPLRHAVRLVDREHRDPAAAEQPERGIGAEPFRREVEQVQFAAAELSLDHPALARVLGGIEEGRVDPELP
jgi:hypothetical protein